MKKILLSLLAATFVSLGISAQSATKVTEMIETANATYGQAAYFSATALGLISDDSSDGSAIKILKSRGVISDDKEAKDLITMKQLAWICANTWDVKGSLMLKLFNTPRYALKQLQADGIVPSTDDPSKKPSGRDVLNVVTLCIEKYPLKEAE